MVWKWSALQANQDDWPDGRMERLLEHNFEVHEAVRVSGRRISDADSRIVNELQIVAQVC